uniref:NADH-ubiquinone oxidoreductase chain 1 n=1 Tax=Aulacus sinensis TaxID=2491146 RepID=A0A3S8V0B2_9HYME|nr:NADH dehydrogenase subunit 1 [Aulacus sinensis]
MNSLNLYNLENLVIIIIMIIMVLLSVAFLTLFERKILGFIQDRMGPNKVFMIGIFQPFSDAIKLMTKEINLIEKLNFMYYMISPLFSLMLMLMLWMIYPFWMNMYSMKLMFLYMISVMSISVYSMMIMGWSSNSSYALLGSLRSISQTISYEVSFILLMLINLMLIESFNLINLKIFQKFNWFFFMLMISNIIFFISVLAELNRSPFDLAEGESELVSGFNVEYGSGGFVMIFLTEYGMILFMSMLCILLFYGGSLIFFYDFSNFIFLSYMIIWIRGSFPRIRYDNLMYLIWKSILPISLCNMMFIILMKLINI